MTKVSTVSTVSANGTTVEVDGRTQVIPWTTLRKAMAEIQARYEQCYASTPECPSRGTWRTRTVGGEVC
jgi:hypothetical protein